MRELKFRVWTGLSMEYNIMVGFLGAFYVKGIDETDSASMSPFNTRYADACPVMQFTGCKDRTGKDIYEGDILRCPTYSTVTGKGFKSTRTKEMVFSVKEYLSYFGYGFTLDGDYDNNYRGMPKEADCEIIGNIYENPWGKYAKQTS